MTVLEVITIVLSLLAFIVSALTAYRTLFAKFQGFIYLKPRVILTRIDKMPAIVVGCELSNLGAKAGSIDDILLHVKYLQDIYSFFPLLSRDDYSIFETYQKSDFEPFQSVLVPANTRVSIYILFSPSNDSFSPLPGKFELTLYSRNSGASKWHKATGQASFPVDEEYAKIWKDPNGQSIMTETTENNSFREELMEKIF